MFCAVIQRPSSESDIDRFIAFASRFLDLAAVPDDLPPRSGC
jgi:hypothetical protein